MKKDQNFWQKHYAFCRGKMYGRKCCLSVVVWLPENGSLNDNSRYNVVARNYDPYENNPREVDGSYYKDVNFDSWEEAISWVKKLKAYWYDEVGYKEEDRENFSINFCTPRGSSLNITNWED